MIMHGHFYSQEEWRRIIWQTICKLEDEENKQTTKARHTAFPDNWEFILSAVWCISDPIPDSMRTCETFVSIACDTSLLKTMDYTIKRRTFGFKMSSRCDLGIPENARHVIMQRPYYTNERVMMRQRQLVSRGRTG